MENKERVIELMLALIFIAILLLVVFFVLSEYGDMDKKESSVSNTYNTNTNNYYVENSDYRNMDYSKYDEFNREVLYLKNNNYRDYDYYENYRDFSDRRFYDYSSYGEHTRRKDFAGSYVDDFKVYIKNKDTKSKYFKVRFYFEDYDGNKFSEIVTKYIRAGEREEITFKDVQFEKYKYWDWNYEIIVDSNQREHYYRDYSNYYGKKGFDYVYY